MSAPAYWKVLHYNHASQALGELFPESLNVVLQLDKIGTCSYSMDLSHNLATETNTRPYYTDFIIQRGTRNIMGGIHTGINIDDANTNTLQVSGQDWLHYLEGCTHPFDPTNPTASLYTAANRDVALIVKDMMDTQLAQSNRLTFAYTLAAIGQLTDYKIDVADSTDLFSRISTLAQIKPGFDFDVSADLLRTFRIYAPQKGTATGFTFQENSNIQLASYSSTGPSGTWIIGIASTPTGGQAGYVYNTPTQGLARRWDKYEQFDTVSSLAQLTTYTQGQGDRDDADQITFTAKYIPQPNEDFWGEVALGDTVRCILTLGGYKNINQLFRVVGIEVNVSDEGEEEITVTFDYGTLSL